MQPSDLILEQFDPFEEELSLIAVRNQCDEIKFYPLIRNQLHQGIRQWSEAYYHDYGKKPYPKRKVGHITLVDKNRDPYQNSKIQLIKLQNECTIAASG